MNDPARTPARTSARAPARTPARTLRQIVLDVALGAGCLLAGLAEAVALHHFTGLRLLLDLALGAPACLLLLLRRRNPLLVAWVGLAALATSASGGWSVLVGIYTVARLRSARAALAVAVTSTAVAAAAMWIFPVDWGDSTPIDLASWLCLCALLVGAGAIVGERQRQRAGLRERWERASAEQQQRALEARQAERARIANELHAVLAGRIERIASRATDLATVTADDAERQAAHAEAVRAETHAALQELRTVIGVLRAPSEADTAAGRP